MKKIILLILMSISISQAQTAPALEFFCDLKVKLDPALIVGETPHGTGGADWQVLRTDGVTELEAHYQFRTDDGTLIYVKNTGIRAATPEIAARLAKGEKVNANEYYFRATPKFEAPKGKYDWINNSLFVCTGERLPDYVLIRVWKVM
ncbi:MAG: hypothetical protein RLZZ209_1527 [Bacteroidota bacterium]